jgi:indole-3-glycerol phosphate synthase / phosphoribosylanthranilate isomerase
MPDATFLSRIVPATRARLAERQEEISFEKVSEQARQQRPALDFVTALRPTDGGINAIPEIKRASPSKGALREVPDPCRLAGRYAQAGASAISVLTEQDFFKGSLGDLQAARKSPYTANVPLLRKDFITDPYQVIEARAAGADTFLLIVAILDDAQLEELLALGRQWGMEALVEVHNADEAERAVRLGARVIGVNARDLRTFEVDTTLLERLRPLIPADRVVVAESGIAEMSDVVRMRGYGAQAILVGERLMRDQFPQAALRHLICLPRALRVTSAVNRSIVKLCGLCSPADALSAYEAGADMLGMVFVPGKRRRVDVPTARAMVDALPADALTVGLFVIESEEDVATMTDIVASTGISMVQVHGSLPLGTLADFPVPVFRANMVAERGMQAIMKESALPQFDAAMPGVWGGSGEVGDWSQAASAASKYPILLAGGLTPENVGVAIRAVRPWGVDVSSGIEGPDGKKDPERMQAFVAATHDY